VLSYCRACFRTVVRAFVLSCVLSYCRTCFRTFVPAFVSTIRTFVSTIRTLISTNKTSYAQTIGSRYHDFIGLLYYYDIQNSQIQPKYTENNIRIKTERSNTLALIQPPAPFLHHHCDLSKNRQFSFILPTSVIAFSIIASSVVV
jgi:hypothetical protein